VGFSFKKLNPIKGVKRAAKAVKRTVADPKRTLKSAVSRERLKKTVGRAAKTVSTGGLSEAVKHKTGRKLVGQAAPVVGGVVGGIFGGAAGAGLGAGLGSAFTNKYLKDKSWKDSLVKGAITGASVYGGASALSGIAGAMGGAGGAAAGAGSAGATGAGASTAGAAGAASAGGTGTLGALGGMGKVAGIAGKAMKGASLLKTGVSLYGGYQGMKGSAAAQEDMNRYESGVEGLLRRQEALAGLDPAVAAAMTRRAQQNLRGAQAARGIYSSGVAAAQEAELMPMIEQQQRAWQLQQLAGISGQYTPLMESAGRRGDVYQGMAGEFGESLADGGSALWDLAGKVGGGIFDYFGGAGGSAGGGGASFPNYQTGEGVLT